MSFAELGAGFRDAADEDLLPDPPPPIENAPKPAIGACFVSGFGGLAICFCIVVKSILLRAGSAKEESGPSRRLADEGFKEDDEGGLEGEKFKVDCFEGPAGGTSFELPDPEAANEEELGRDGAV